MRKNTYRSVHPHLTQHSITTITAVSALWRSRRSAFAFAMLVVLRASVMAHARAHARISRLPDGQMLIGV